MTPFAFAYGTAAPGSSSLTVTVAAATQAGDTLTFAVSGTAAASPPLAVTDSRGNRYELIVTLTAGSAVLRVYECSRSRYALTTTDTVTAAMGGTASAVSIIGTDMGHAQRDIAATGTATGTSGTTQSATSGALDWEGETVLALEWVSTDQPAWSAPVTALQQEGGSSAGYLGAGYTGAPGVAAVTVSSTTGTAPPAWAVAAIPYAPAFPDGALDLMAELDLNGTWTDVTPWLDHGPVSTGRGHPDESTSTAPATLAMTLTNTDGRFSSKAPVSPYFPYLMRNVPCRVSVPAQVPYLRIETDAASYASCPDATRLHITGDTDIQLDMRLTTQAQLHLASKWNSGSNERSWALVQNSNGTVTFAWSTDGTSGNEHQATSTLPLPPGRVALRVTLAVSSSTVTFYTAPSIAGPWTQLGTAAALGGSTSVFAGTAAVATGYNANFSESWFDSGTVPPGLNGNVLGFRLYSGIGGTLEADAAFTAQSAGTTTWTDVPGNTWTLSGTAEISARAYRGHFEVPEWPQKQSPGGQDVTVAAAGGGLLRRIGQRNNPAGSPMYRAYTRLTGIPAPVAYWPMEDGPNSTRLASALGGPAMYFSGTPTLSSSSAFAASSPLPVTNRAVFTAQVPAATWIDNVIRFLMQTPSGGEANNTVVATVPTTGTVATLTMTYGASGGSVTLFGYNASGTQLFDSGPLITPSGFDTIPLRVSMGLQDVSGNVQWSLQIEQPGGPAYALGGTVSGTIGAVTRVTLNPAGGLVGTVLGHCSVQPVWDTLYDLDNYFNPEALLTGALNAWFAEPAGVRFARLCAEEGIQFRGRGDLTATPLMGNQGIQTITQLLQECADADRGLWTELRQQLGFGYVTRSALYNQAAQVTADYVQDHLEEWASDPLEDDQQVVNDVTVTQTSGGSFSRQYAAPGQPITGGRLSTQSPPDGAGTYDQDYSVNLAYDSDLDNEAGWILHLGTVDQPRYPGIVLDLADRDLSPMWWQILDMDIGDRVVIDNPPAWLGPDPVSQLVQGLGEELFYETLTLTVQAVPELPYEVAADGAGFHVDTDGSSLRHAVTAGTPPVTWGGTPENTWSGWQGTSATAVASGTELIITSTGPTGGFWQGFGPNNAVVAGQTVAAVAVITCPQALGAVGVGIHIGGGSDTYTESATVAVAAGQTVILVVTATAVTGQTTWQPYVIDGENSPAGDQMYAQLVYGGVCSATPNSLSVNTATGYPVWSTVTTDLPWDINIGGERMTVVGVSGSSSPQAFTVLRSVNGVVVAQAAGAPIALWNTPVAAL